jgi:hypothetical protein
MSAGAKTRYVAQVNPAVPVHANEENANSHRVPFTSRWKALAKSSYKSAAED